MIGFVVLQEGTAGLLQCHCSSPVRPEARSKWSSLKKAFSNFRLASSHHLPGTNQGSQGATKAYPGIQRIQQACRHTKKQLPQFSEDKPDIMPSSAQERMDLVAQAAQKIVATKLAICLHVANHRLDRVSAVSTPCSSAASGHAYCR